MARTTGFVQSLTISTSQVCVQIGPSPTSAELLVINIASGADTAVVAFQTSMIDALAAAVASRRTVAASHADSDSNIVQLVVNPT